VSPWTNGGTPTTYEGELPKVPGIHVWYVQFPAAWESSISVAAGDLIITNSLPGFDEVINYRHYPAADRVILHATNDQLVGIINRGSLLPTLLEPPPMPESVPPPATYSPTLDDLWKLLQGMANRMTECCQMVSDLDRLFEYQIGDPKISVSGKGLLAIAQGLQAMSRKTWIATDKGDIQHAATSGWYDLPGDGFELQVTDKPAGTGGLFGDTPLYPFNTPVPSLGYFVTQDWPSPGWDHVQFITTEQITYWYLTKDASGISLTLAPGVECDLIPLVRVYDTYTPAV